jgi:hypothetical protein
MVWANLIVATGHNHLAAGRPSHGHGAVAEGKE